MSKKKKPADLLKISENEKAELSFFMDRLRMQDPQGPSLENCLRSLKQSLLQREALAAALLEALSHEGGPVCFRAFCALQEIVQDKRLTRIVRQAAYRFRQKGFVVCEASAPVQDSSPVVLVKAQEMKNEAYLAASAKDHMFQYSAYVFSKSEDSPCVILMTLGAGFSCELLGIYSLSRREFKDKLRKIADFLESPIREVSLGHMARVHETLVSFNRIPAEYRTDVPMVRRLLEPYVLEDPRPYFLQMWDQKGLAPLREVDLPDLVDFITSNLEVVPYEGLFSDKSALERWVTGLKTIQDGVIRIPRYLAEERLDKSLGEATRELFPLEVCRGLAKDWEEVALWTLLNEDDPFRVEKVFALSEHAQDLKDSGSSPVMRRIVELAMAIFFNFFTPDLNADLRRLEKMEKELDEGLKRTPSGLYVPRGVLE
ncbi:MAG: hypothetical protein WHS46_13965 [Desulfosoma sp.]